MKVVLSLLWLMSCMSLHAQSSPEDVVHKFFQAMSDIDTAYLNDVLADDVVMTTAKVAQGKNSIVGADKAEFIAAVSISNIGDLDEQISNIRIERDGGLANIWMDYSLHYQGNLSHCGVNNFTMALDKGVWKIISIADNRRKVDCISFDATTAINAMLDKWHLGAANADSTSYFELMTSNSIYVGTDKTEVWSKRDFLSFAAPYFAKGKAWAFTRVERNVYSEDYEKIAWFDEVLDTWMGACRGSGVVVKDGSGAWKVQHYVLSIAVANDDINDYLKVINKER